MTGWRRRGGGLEEAGRRLLVAGGLPEQAGFPATLIVTVGLSDLERRAGRATTHHGGMVSVAEALRLAGQAGLLPVVLGDGGGVLAYGRSARLASRGQRAAVFARDRGCSYPQCPVPGAGCQLHHALDWVRGGPTDVDNLPLTCGYHNREAPLQGWSTVMIDGVPYWRPPRWRDPSRTPQRNYHHHPELLLTNPTRQPGGPGTTAPEP